MRAAAEWSEAYPNDNVIVLHDPDGQIHEWYGDGSYFPSISILNENFQFIHYDPDGPLTGITTLPDWDSAKTLRANAIVSPSL